jgi:dUTP pyrophosphatase
VDVDLELQFDSGPVGVPIDVLYPVQPLPQIESSEVALRYQRVNKNARIERDPENAGYDVWAIEDVICISAGEVALIDTGLRFEIPQDYCLIVKERSSMAKRGLRVGGGVIDWSYRGNLYVCIQNTSSSAIVLNMDNAIAQCLLVYIPHIPLQEIDKVSQETERGAQGFGSTDA